MVNSGRRSEAASSRRSAAESARARATAAAAMRYRRTESRRACARALSKTIGAAGLRLSVVETATLSAAAMLALSDAPPSFPALESVTAGDGCAGTAATGRFAPAGARRVSARTGERLSTITAVPAVMRMAAAIPRVPPSAAT